jgi:hypothetical protein
MPFPNDLYFNDSKTGQLNIPGDTAVAQNGPLLEQNHLDGFGTQSDISVYFTTAIDASSINKDDVIVIPVSSDPTTKVVSTKNVGTPLKFGTDFSAAVSPGTDSGGSILTIKPLHPLKASTVDPITGAPVPATYVVIVTTGLKDTNGDAATPSPDYSKVVAADLPVLKGGKMGTTGDAKLDTVAEFTIPQLAVAAAAKIDPTQIAISFSFSTQYLNLGLALLDQGATATTQPTGTGEVVDTSETVCDVLVASGQLPSSAACAAVTGSLDADVFVGGVTLPYYLTVPAKGSTAALTDSWHNVKNGGDTIISADPSTLLPKATATQNIPLLVTIPNAASGCPTPPAGWPVVIFQHGITRNREDMIAIASGFAHICTAVVAMDLPLHGVTDTTDPFYKNQLFAGTPVAALLTVPVSERTFDMDATGHAGATGKNIGGSGAQFINLTSTLTSRDNLREGAADLINLTVTLPHVIGITPPATVNTFDPANIYYVGHSLGGIVGTTFLGADTIGAQLLGAAPRIKAATLAMPGGHIAELLRTSAEFGPIIDAGLTQKGIVKGTQEYYDFYSQAQTVVEDGDPANYAAAAAAGHPIHIIEVVGGFDKFSLPDQVVPNSSTDLLVSIMGLTRLTAAGAAPMSAGIGSGNYTQFIAGDHGSILDPTPPTGAPASDAAVYLAVTTEMQEEAASVVATGGAATVVADPTYIKP